MVVSGDVMWLIEGEGGVRGGLYIYITLSVCVCVCVCVHITVSVGVCV